MRRSRSRSDLILLAALVYARSPNAEDVCVNLDSPSHMRSRLPHVVGPLAIVLHPVFRPPRLRLSPRAFVAYVRAAAQEAQGREVAAFDLYARLGGVVSGDVSFHHALP